MSRSASAATNAQKRSALQHRQIAVDQPRRGRGRGGAEVALLQQDRPQAASRGVARHADAVQAAANDRKIVVRHGSRLVSGIRGALHLAAPSLANFGFRKGQAKIMMLVWFGSEVPLPDRQAIMKRTPGHHVIARSTCDEAIHSFFTRRNGIASSRSLSSGAHARDPSAPRNDGLAV